MILLLGQETHRSRMKYHGQKEESGSVNVGKLTMSIHTGTHIDAPFHFDNDGKKVLDLDIQVYVGPTRIIDVSNLESIGKKELENFHLEGVERLLFSHIFTW